MGVESPHIPLTLFVSREPILLETRVRVLEQSGVGAVPSHPAQVTALLRSYQFRVLILCNSLPVEEKREVIAQFKLRYPSGRVVSVNSDDEAPQVLGADVEMYPPVMPSQWERLCHALKAGGLAKRSER
ncbi:MAG TPA: hypothetical protein VGC88_10895 [Terriglobales bacterium]|jgi:DNA-binding NarL/FixJ family response regulator